jgi:hypothetical protein
MRYSNFHKYFPQFPSCVSQSFAIYSFMRYLLQFTLSYIIDCTRNIADTLRVFMNKTGRDKRRGERKWEQANTAHHFQLELV